MAVKGSIFWTAVFVRICSNERVKLTLWSLIWHNKQRLHQVNEVCFGEGTASASSCTLFPDSSFACCLLIKASWKRLWLFPPHFSKDEQSWMKLAPWGILTDSRNFIYHPLNCVSFGEWCCHVCAKHLQKKQLMVLDWFDVARTPHGIIRCASQLLPCHFSLLLVPRDAITDINPYVRWTVCQDTREWKKEDFSSMYLLKSGFLIG